MHTRTHTHTGELLCCLLLPSLLRKKKGQEGPKQQSIKYTAQRLYEKGVILEIEGLPEHQ